MIFIENYQMLEYMVRVTNKIVSNSFKVKYISDLHMGLQQH